MAVEKAKYWVAVLYPESMIDNWQDNISDILQVPYSYCIHNKDKDGHKGDRKIHLHLILAFPNTTTYNHALSLFKQLQPSCMICKKVINIRYMYNYLIHDTDSCRKSHKYLYNITERIDGNNFDIGSYEQISLEEKKKMCRELAKVVIDKNITNMADLYMMVINNLSVDYEEVCINYSGFLSNICKGVYLMNK